MCGAGRRREEMNQDVGHGRMEVGQSHPAPLSSWDGGGGGNVNVSEFYTSIRVRVVDKTQLLVKCIQGICLHS